MISKNIKIILFDFGGVIASEGFIHGTLLLSKLFNKDFQSTLLIASKEAAYKTGWARGEVGEEIFWKVMNEKVDSSISMEKHRHLYLDNFVPRKQIIDLIKKLKTKYKVGILSDQTNWIFEIDKYYDFLKYFEYRFISYEVGYSKEDNEIFEIAISKCNVPPEKILFIDDRDSILTLAQKFNIQTYKFESISKTVTELSNILF